MTIEHIYPKSKGGTKESHNVTLTCQPCNSKKSTIYPYKNYKGEELKPSNPYPFFHPFQERGMSGVHFYLKNNWHDRCNTVQYKINLNNYNYVLFF